MIKIIFHIYSPLTYLKKISVNALITFPALDSALVCGKISGIVIITSYAIRITLWVVSIIPSIASSIVKEIEGIQSITGQRFNRFALLIITVHYKGVAV